MRKLSIVVLVGALLQVSSAAAQDFAWQGFAAQDALNTLHHQLLEQTIEGAGSADSAKTPVASVDTTYTASPEVSARAQQQFLDFVRQQAGDVAAEEMAEIFEQHSPTQNWADLVSAEGLQPGDAVDAMASYLSINWIIANQQPEAEFPMSPIENQVRAALTGAPAFQALDNDERQEFAEILMLNFLLQHAALSQAYIDGDAATMGKLADAAIARFQNEMGLDLRALTPTENGLVPNG